MNAGRWVLETLAKKLTPLPLSESLTAIGAGPKNDPARVRWGKVGEIVLSRLVTLPVACLIAAGAKLILR